MEELKAEMEVIKSELLAAAGEISKLMEIVKQTRKTVFRLDFGVTGNIRKSYGFSGDKMFYIGVATGNVYEKPIRNDLVNIMHNIHTASVQDILKLNDYFIKE